jgi:hypothetical protein
MRHLFAIDAKLGSTASNDGENAIGDVITTTSPPSDDVESNTEPDDQETAKARPSS